MGVRGLFGYKTIFPQNIEHYDVVGGGGNAGPETRQLRRTFVGGNERDNVIAASEKAQNLTAEQKAEMGITETTTNLWTFALILELACM